MAAGAADLRLRRPLVGGLLPALAVRALGEADVHHRIELEQGVQVLRRGVLLGRRRGEEGGDVERRILVEPCRRLRHGARQVRGRGARRSISGLLLDRGRPRDHRTATIPAASPPRPSRRAERQHQHARDRQLVQSHGLESLLRPAPPPPPRRCRRPPPASSRTAGRPGSWPVRAPCGTAAVAIFGSSEPASTMAPAERAAASEPAPQHVAGPRDQRADRPRCAAQPPGRLGVRQALEMAEDHGAAIALRQPADLLVHGRGVLVMQGCGIGRLRRPVRRASSRPRISRDDDGDRPEPGPCVAIRVGDAVQPGPQQVGPADRAGPPRQHQEHGLERVVRGVLVAEQMAADAQHHRPMPRHQGRECRLGPARRGAPRTARRVRRRSSRPSTPSRGGLCNGLGMASVSTVRHRSTPSRPIVILGLLSSTAPRKRPFLQEFHFGRLREPSAMVSVNLALRFGPERLLPFWHKREGRRISMP